MIQRLKQLQICTRVANSIDEDIVMTQFGEIISGEFLCHLVT